MKIKALTATAVISIFSFQNISAAEFGLPQSPSSVEVKAPSAPSASPLLAEYSEYYSALTAVSEKAFAARQDSPEFYEARTYGVYLRARVEELSARLLRTERSDAFDVCAAIFKVKNASFNELISRMPAAMCPGLSPKTSRAGRERGEVSGKISSELEKAFNFGAAEKTAEKGEPIKAGYCQINYVKNGVPFLVQYDGFLKKGEVVLTFDDGPGSVTGEFSGVLKAGGAESLFFVLGSKLGTNGKATLAKEAADGHAVGVHGYYHATANEKPFTAMTTKAIIEQLGGVADTITAAAGQKPAFFRPPYGIITAEALRATDSQLGLTPVGWTIDTLDWSTKDPDQLYANTISMIQKRGKGIVLMHDIHSQSRAAAAKLLKWLADNGYKVVSPDRLAQAYKAQ
ncbi:MAG TPA: polysaccharide deacetylase family protein [Elusimicrobiales bacterium]|nr:polysaccharide deacetylase family protein [Elusimicrobiales bacterium]